MSYMAFSTLMQDPNADMAAGRDLAERKYGEQGATRTGVSIALTGTDRVHPWEVHIFRILWVLHMASGTINQASVSKRAKISAIMFNLV